MRRANEAIERERHPIPTIEEVLHNLNGSTVFSKLDLRWGFHQIELDEESRQITTFVTHRGLYRYKRLMFGIPSAPEKYQKIVSDVLQGCEGVANIADDVIVHGCGIEQHDKNLLADLVLDRLRQCGLTLNARKCQFRLPKLTFFEHDLSKNGVAPSEEKVAALQKAKLPKNPNPKHVVQRALTLPSLSHTGFFDEKGFTKSFRSSHLLSRNLANTLQVLIYGNFASVQRSADFEHVRKTTNQSRRIGSSSQSASRSVCESLCHAFNYFFAWSRILYIFTSLFSC